jgi:hypothetical protein
MPTGEVQLKADRTPRCGVFGASLLRAAARVRAGGELRRKPTRLSLSSARGDAALRAAQLGRPNRNNGLPP